MFNLVSFYDSQKHTLIDGEISPFVKRMDDKLFVVRYNELGVFCICRWLAEPYDIFVDVINLGKSLGNFNRKKADELRRQTFKPITASEVNKTSSEAESDYYHFRQEFNEELKELDAIRGEKL